ncbi:wall-associated receptor kinase 1-like [Chenopodium quinoa]|uniref:Uncharacterized protein n=1 Tax=Chenopodium quinoa TaxID=63459 RepID=A0A803KTL2_CHEQI|nr:wall-associated receptor kinase 1-like [Chenopodium quinoa]
MSYPTHIHLTIIFLFWVVLQYVARGVIASPAPPAPQVLAPHCPDKCGNVSVPYPFGLEDGCYYEDPHNNFKISCDRTMTPPTAYFGTSFAVFNTSVLTGEICIRRDISYDCYNKNQSNSNYTALVNIRGFTISSTNNLLIAMGCDTYVWFTGVRHGKPYQTGCMTKCGTLDEVSDNACNGVGCCIASLPDEVTNISTTIGSYSNHSGVPFSPCSVAYPAAVNEYRYNKMDLTRDLKFFRENRVQIPVVFNWAIGSQNCSVAQEDGSFLCKSNTLCVDPPNQQGYHCKCKDGFIGNPYLPQGCADIDECKQSNDCEKPEYCVNQIGSYDCKCPKGFHGNGTKAQPCSSDKKSWIIPVVATAGVAGAMMILLVVGFILYWKHGKIKNQQIREKNFRQNGGLLLHQKLSGRKIDGLKVFTAQDLEIATNNYSEKYVIGRGGFGIVYKGILTNNQHIAIKRSLKVDPRQVEQFINEVIVLSQINNRNVVKLLGCCLETEVPLLVYEFITNGTLYDHLVDAVKASILTWNTRLKIALEVANVLSYLHTTISTPIIHRDIKSMNILLDDNYTAKVADFGASRLVPEDKGQIATMVQGTWGYLDPEYMQTRKLTEKSDVYSFGVVLAELITRKRAICYDRADDETSLAMHLLIQMKEDQLLSILDKTIVSEGTIEQIQQMANLATWCLMVKAEDRPSMKEVAIELETIKRLRSQPSWSSKDGSFQEDSVSETLLEGYPRSGTTTSGCSSSMEVDLYNPRLDSILADGR